MHDHTTGPCDKCQLVYSEVLDTLVIDCPDLRAQRAEKLQNGAEI